jgi:hypothetical protein
MKRITYLAVAGALVATSGLGAWTANAATDDNPASHDRTTARHGADDPAGHHRHHGADDAIGHHAPHGADDAAGHQGHGELQPGDDHGGPTNTPEPGDDNGGLTNTSEPGDDNGGHNEPGDDNSGSDDGADDSGHHGGGDDHGSDG